MGRGTVTCGEGKTFDKSVSCQLNTLYVESDFHCDVNDDGIEDAGEVFDFENSSFAAIAELTGGPQPNDFKVLAPVALQDNPDLDVYIDWGDGTCNRITNDTKALATHTYSEIGKYRIRMKGTVGKFGYNKQFHST